MFVSNISIKTVISKLHCLPPGNTGINGATDRKVIKDKHIKYYMISGTRYVRMSAGINWKQRSQSKP